MKLYIVTADTYDAGYGANIELLRVTDNEEDKNQSVEYAKTQGWPVTVTEADLNKPTRKYLGGYYE